MMKKFFNKSTKSAAFSILAALFISFTFFSCQTLKPDTAESDKPDLQEQPESPEETVHNFYLSRNLRAKGQLTADQLAFYFCQKNPDEDINHMVNFALYYIQEGDVEGINSDVAFAQMCLETGYLRFGNLVQPEFHNYCGLGAMDAEHPGEKFETEQLGVRAHIQHLHAYATHEEEKLVQPLIDPRYKWVHKAKYAETIEGLSGTWATDPNYAIKIEAILQTMETMFPINQ